MSAIAKLLNLKEDIIALLEFSSYGTLTEHFEKLHMSPVDFPGSSSPPAERYSQVRELVKRVDAKYNKSRLQQFARGLGYTESPSDAQPDADFKAWACMDCDFVVGANSGTISRNERLDHQCDTAGPQPSSSSEVVQDPFSSGYIDVDDEAVHSSQRRSAENLVREQLEQLSRDDAVRQLVEELTKETVVQVQRELQAMPVGAVKDVLAEINREEMSGDEPPITAETLTDVDSVKQVVVKELVDDLQNENTEAARADLNTMPASSVSDVVEEMVDQAAGGITNLRREEVQEEAVSVLAQDLTGLHDGTAMHKTPAASHAKQNPWSGVHV
eukprot:scaffold910_cov396-Prasinococcus_capsulatus_cf.AAC.37